MMQKNASLWQQTGIPLQQTLDGINNGLYAFVNTCLRQVFFFSVNQLHGVLRSDTGAR
jgi:hypothetical protein